MATGSCFFSRAPELKALTASMAERVHQVAILVQALTAMDAFV